MNSGRLYRYLETIKCGRSANIVTKIMSGTKALNFNLIPKSIGNLKFDQNTNSFMES